MSEQEVELTRVRDRIQQFIRVFFKEQGIKGQFHAEDLRRFIRKHDPVIAPGSPDRVLRDMRQRGQLDYRVINRHQSLYQIDRLPR